MRPWDVRAVIQGDLGVPLEEQAPKYERLWPIVAIFQVLHRAGLAVEHLGECAEEYRDAFPNLRPELRGRIPMTFSLIACRQAL